MSLVDEEEEERQKIREAVERPDEIQDKDDEPEEFEFKRQETNEPEKGSAAPAEHEVVPNDSKSLLNIDRDEID